MRRRLAAASGATISTLAAAYGLTPRAIRYYESCGLVTSRRDHANRRTFDTHARDRLRMIAQLRSAGLSLREFAPILALEDAGREAQLLAAIAALTARLETLERAREIVCETRNALQRELPTMTGPAAPRLVRAGRRRGDCT